MSDPLGMIGLGLLGGALAARFAAAGHAVVGYDTSAAARRALAALGGRAVMSPGDVFAACSRVVLSLPSSPVVAAVLREVGDAPRAGQVIIDTTTGAPEDAEAFAADLAGRQVGYIDATVLGSSEQARQGDVVVMAGGPAALVEGAAGLFGCFAKRWFHVGPSGAGARMKLVVNLVLGLNRAALAEGLALAAALGLGLPAALEVLQSGAAYSRIMDTKGPKMVARDFAPAARLAQHLKDVRLIVAAGEKAGLALPLSEAHRGLLERVVARGGGDDDNSAVIRAYDRPAGSGTAPGPT